MSRMLGGGGELKVFIIIMLYILLMFLMIRVSLNI